MYNLMMVKKDHYLHMRKALLSQTEFVFIHTPGKAQIVAPVAGIEPSRPPNGDAYGNTRHYYPAEKFDEVSLRLAFEQGWEEQEYIPYSTLQSQVKAATKVAETTKKSLPKLTEASKAAMDEFSKLLSSIPPKISVAEKEWEHTHWAYENKYSYHNPETIEYSQADYFTTTEMYKQHYDSYTKPSPVTIKEFYEVTKGFHVDTIAGELMAAAKYDSYLEKKYSIVVQVYEDSPGLHRIVVIGTNGQDMYKSSYIVPNHETFYVTAQVVTKMKQEVIYYLQDKEANGSYLTF